MLHVKQPRTGYAKVGAQVSFSSPPFAREPRVGVRGSPRLPSPLLPHLHSICLANRAGAHSLALPARASVSRAQVPWSVAQHTAKRPAKGCKVPPNTLSDLRIIISSEGNLGTIAPTCVYRLFSFAIRYPQTTRSCPSAPPRLSHVTAIYSLDRFAH